MKDRFVEQVKEFHKAFGHPVNEKPVTELDDDFFDMVRLRKRLIREEVDHELMAALNNLYTLRMDEDAVADITNARIEILDAICDSIVVLIGTALCFGFDIETAMNRVHASNMSKLGSNGKPIYRGDGKIMKGPNYFPPQLDDCV